MVSGPAWAKAIAELLTGAVNPSGRLPLTFPLDLDQTPRPELPGPGTPHGTPTTVSYAEGAEVGYRWFARPRLTPRYAFGHGLSYTGFAYPDLEVSGGDTVTATFTVTNVGARAGADVPAALPHPCARRARQRLLGFERVELEPGQSRRVTCPPIHACWRASMRRRSGGASRQGGTRSRWPGPRMTRS